MKSESSLFEWKEIRFDENGRQYLTHHRCMKASLTFSFFISEHHHYFQINWILWNPGTRTVVKIRFINGFLVKFHQIACALHTVQWEFSRNYTFRKSGSARNCHCYSCKHIGLSILQLDFSTNSKNMALSIEQAPKP